MLPERVVVSVVCFAGIYPRISGCDGDLGIGGVEEGGFAPGSVSCFASFMPGTGHSLLLRTVQGLTVSML